MQRTFIWRKILFDPNGKLTLLQSYSIYFDDTESGTMSF